jgi:hypothetical protein
MAEAQEEAWGAAWVVADSLPKFNDHQRSIIIQGVIMKTRIPVLLMALATIYGVAPAIAAGPGGGAANPATRPACCVTPTVTAIDSEAAATLLWMREEEKLARDVYLSLNDKWQDRIFRNIAASEQKHFDALGSRIALFGLSDPALPTVGQFTNPTLQELYFSLRASGVQSYSQALTVGATFEDLDIRDLMTALETTTNPSLQTTYRNLLEGSKNHLRTFVFSLQALGQDYTPQYTDPALFDAILGN